MDTDRLPSTDAASDRLGLIAKDAAKLVGVSRAHFLKLYGSDRTPRPRRLGRKVLWSRPELIDWWERGCPPFDQWQAARKGGAR